MASSAPSLKPILDNALADHNAGRLPSAELGYRRALSIDRQHVDANYDLALLLQSTHRLAEAEAHYRAALKRNPRHARSWNNLGNILRDTGRFEKAVDAFRHALEVQPDHLHARTNQALALLSMGRYAEAWPLYEARLAAHAVLPKLRCARWNGESLQGRRLLLVAEQGFGDAVQFIRYAPVLRERGVSQLSVLCRAPLEPLLATCAGVDRVVAEDDGTHDLYVPLLSLPLHLGTTLENVPAEQPYLHALPDREAQWRARLPAGRRVGLVWRGSAGHANDARRSLRLDQLGPLWRVPDVTFVSLQKGAGEEEAAHPPAEQPMVALGHEVGDFGDLAALVASIDLVICVDTAIAHVAGALGKPCWVLVPAIGCDWRWFGGADPTRSPWYPRHLRVFRQPPGGDWTPLVNALPALLLASLGNI